MRFAFGQNWSSFVGGLDESAVAEAARSLQLMLAQPGLEECSFLDLGCGSGLFSLAARRLGSPRVHSLDVDPQCVECARQLQQRFEPAAQGWTVAAADALDGAGLAQLGQWDVVYAWGVLHHTGDMWQALANVAPLVRPGGRLFVSIYNDQGLLTKLWKQVKRFYNRGRSARWVVTLASLPYFVLAPAAVDLLRGRSPLARYRDYHRRRGMSRWHDVVDWLGGYPFEAARPEEILAFYRERGFELLGLKTVGGKMGCNEFVFRLCA